MVIFYDKIEMFLVNRNLKSERAEFSESYAPFRKNSISQVIFASTIKT